MPWDGSKLLVHDFELDSRELISGGEEESVAEPQWHEDGSLTFISDRTGWWNLYRWTPGGEVEALVELEAEIGVPQWEFGTGRYAVLPDGRIVFARWRDGLDGLAVRLTDGTVADLELPFTFVESIACDRDSSVVVIAGSPQVRPAVVRVRLGEANGIEQVETLRAEPEPSELGIDPAYISIPEPFDFDSAGGRRAHGLLYRPRNPACRAPDGELPPLVVHVHGGPTGCAWPELDLDFQYLTSRGFTVLDLNYGGSTGYGRAYRELLDGNWGVVDVQDSIAAAQALAKTGEVDPGRMSISGGSAGGYTTLACLARAQTPFAAGADYFGIADLEAMTQETHKFESRYLDRLVAPYPEQREVYVQRSPIHHIAEFSTPLIVLQGLEDEVVPPNQATMIVEALRGKGVPVAYMAFEGEQHGFRLEANIRRALDSELSFYAQVFGFELPADEGIEPVAIERPEASAAESNSPR
jgi:dipeptidyl aminopeptidase/acylaminoacyl peptidase